MGRYDKRDLESQAEWLAIGKAGRCRIGWARIKKVDHYFDDWGRPSADVYMTNGKQEIKITGEPTSHGWSSFLKFSPEEKAPADLITKEEVQAMTD